MIHRILKLIEEINEVLETNNKFDLMISETEKIELKDID